MLTNWTKFKVKISLIKFKVKIIIKNTLYGYNTRFYIDSHTNVEKDVFWRLGPNSNLSIDLNTHVGNFCRFECSENANISIGKNVQFTGNNFVACMDSIEIGDNTLIGEFVSIRDNDHEYIDVNNNIDSQGYNTSSIKISDDVWIGRGSVILKGVSIGKHCVIGANSVVNKNVDSYSVAVGAPAKVIKIYNFKTQKWEKI
ncbi:acyltransferase [Methanococcoides alaskense]|uniref:Acetyltransferase-like isoleucine patch superfamily enzyme n=1 Tax=Methanococcoides alaskense TaxID=325778 RepID=A0AA90ZD81_9EURY|nr:acyltransferase [Methanococcoides alaskense]MDA0524406.1 acyltransferase [Methanococcoides alaskense]MDR6223223.1 acetyltransferase-like isoleucine patch superfamily enzyme [Methanococcoides alaskense]